MLPLLIRKMRYLLGPAPAKEKPNLLHGIPDFFCDGHSERAITRYADADSFVQNPCP